MNAVRSIQTLTLPRLCGWAFGYALRRPGPLLAVMGSQLLKVALDIAKPFPMVFLIDYVLRGQATPPLVAQIVEVLPGAPTAPTLPVPAPFPSTPGGKP